MTSPPAPILVASELGAWANAQRDAGRSIVFTNGCFDLLHEGHARSIEEAARLGDVLLVATNSDASARTLKGPDRPVVGQDARAALLAALRWVDAVTIFDAPSVLDTILAVRPHIVAKGGEYDETKVVGASEIQAWGGRVARLSMIEGVGTTHILSRIRHGGGNRDSPTKD